MMHNSKNYDCEQTNPYRYAGDYNMFMGYRTGILDLPQASFVEACAEEHIPWDGCHDKDGHHKAEYPAAYWLMADGCLAYSRIIAGAPVDPDTGIFPMEWGTVNLRSREILDHMATFPRFIPTGGCITMGAHHGC